LLVFDVNNKEKKTQAASKKTQAKNKHMKEGDEERA
jgi:hypothetical protein